MIYEISLSGFGIRVGIRNMRSISSFFASYKSYRHVSLNSSLGKSKLKRIAKNTSTMSIKILYCIFSYRTKKKQIKCNAFVDRNS